MSAAPDLHSVLAAAESPKAAPSPLVAALDVGVSKTVCLAARRDPVMDFHPDRPLRALGVGVQSAPAIASGKSADFEACARAMRIAIDEAAFMAGAPITRVVASYGGPGVQARIVRAPARVRGQQISDRDLTAALAQAERMAQLPGREALHVEPLRYFVDDGAPTLDPVGRSGRALSVEACVVSAPADAIQALRACAREAGVEVEDVVAGPYAAGIAALAEHEREDGALVIDMGAGTMGLAVFAVEGLVHAETVKLGGVRLTRDLARKLETTFAAAERIKLAYGAIGAGFDPREAVQAPRIGAEGRLEASVTLRGAIAETIQPRVAEMLRTAKMKFAEAGFLGEQGPHRAVIVGGGAQLPGMRELAQEILGMPVRVGRPFDLSGFDHGEAGPAFAAAAGLLRWRMDRPTLADVETSFQPSLRQAADAMRGAAGRALSWLRDNF